MSSSRAALASCLVLAALAAAFLGWTWLAWPDLLIDFGREAYVPWRLAEGERLYADLAYFNGPLSPHWNALLFSLFGPSLGVLFVANALVASLLACQIYRLTRVLSDRLAAFVCTAVFVCLFVFGHLVSIGNYNYLAPYSHELTHGLLLLAVLLGLLWRVAESGGSPASILGVGLCLGFSFLTKAEIFAAAVAATTACLGSLAWRAGKPPPLRSVLGVCLGALLPVLVAGSILGQQMPLGEAVSGLLGTWSALGGSEVASLAFYRRGAGLEAPLTNLVSMGSWALLDALVLAALVWLARRLSPAASHGRVAAGVGFAACFVLLWGVSGLGWVAWSKFWRPLPLAMLGLAALNIHQTLRAAEDAGEGGRADAPVTQPGVAAVRLAAIAAAGVLLAKMALNARLAQYGFSLAMPATLVAIAALLHGLPQWVPAPGGRRLLRASCLGLLAAVVVVHVQASGRQLARKNFQLRSGHGEHSEHETLRTDSIRGPVVSRVLEEMRARVAPDDTVLVLPEGVMVNYLSRRATATRHLNFMPPELAIYGEAEIVRELVESPPDWVLLVHKDTSEYGAAFFGRDYGLALARWVGERYEPVARFGKQPFREPNQFGMVLLAPRPESESSFAP